jgi:hypothetical protein
MTFDELVAVATLGVSRKGFAAAGLHGINDAIAASVRADDPAAALLDAAALLTVAQRAGVRPHRMPAPLLGPEAPEACVEVLQGASEPEAGARLTPAAPTAARRTAAEGAAAAERELSARGSRLLARTFGLDRLRGSAAFRTELLGDLLIAMCQAGYVLPAPVLPSVLDIASRAPELRPTVASVLGTRGRWLAAHRADWQQVADAAPAARTGTGATAPTAASAARPSAPTAGRNEADGGAGGDETEVWRVGTLAQRRDYLIGLRDRDPRAGLELLAAGWSRESKAERVGLLAVLGRDLAADDEEFLKNALGDRAGEVREVARQLLARLPESAFSRRVADRAAAVLRLAGEGPDARLVAYPPDGVDESAVRDGIEPRPPAGWVDARGWRLSQIIAGAPLADWTSRLRMTPAQIVALPVEGADAIYLRAGWRLAAVRQGAARQAAAHQAIPAGESAPQGTNAVAGTGGTASTGHDPDANTANPELADWALALLGADLGAGVWLTTIGPPDAALAGLLPAGLRAERAAAMLAKASDNASAGHVYSTKAELASHPVPWPPVLADTVLDAMAHEVLKPKLTDLSQAVVETAGRGMPATGEKDYAAELTRLANVMPQSWMPEMHAAVESINLRRAFLAELR